MKNINFGLISFVVSLFFAGAFIGGEFHRQRAMKAELKAIQETQNRINAEIAAANENYVQKKQLLLQEASQIYTELDSILQQKNLNSRQLKAARDRVNETRTAIDLESKVLENVLKTHKLKINTAEE